MTMSRSTATRTVLLAVATVAAAGVHLPALSAAPGTYVAVGDSFTAGPGVLNQQLDKFGMSFAGGILTWSFDLPEPILAGLAALALS